MATLDIEQPQALIDYLRAAGHIDAREIPQIRLLHGGVSNRTVWVSRVNGEQWVLKQALEKLRVEADWFSRPDRILREAAGIELLPRWAGEGSIPQFKFLDEDHYLLAMEAVPQPHRNWKQVLLSEGPDPALVEQFAGLLANIHGKSSADELGKTRFSEKDFFISLRLEPYYQFAGQRVLSARDFLESLVGDTLKVADCVVHGDYSPKNILVYQDRLILLDHEVIHWGDPAFDIGFSTTHLLSKTLHVKNHRSAFREAVSQYWNTYRDQVGFSIFRGDFEERCIRHTLGCLLARVEGRSPLEYLNESEKNYQKRMVLDLISNLPSSMEALIDSFVFFNPHT